MASNSAIRVRNWEICLSLSLSLSLSVIIITWIIQGAEISPQKSEKMVENLVNPGTTNNSNTNGKNKSGDEN